jgi:reductive dehalogenase
MIVDFVYYFFGALISFLLALFSAYSLIEKKLRATILSFLLLILFGGIWIGGQYYWEYAPIVQIILIAFILIFGLIFFLPFNKQGKFEYGTATGKVDERDTMFAREEYFSGSDKYEKYYSKHPELKAIDDHIRNLPALLSPGGRYYNEFRSGLIQAMFRTIGSLTTRVDGTISSGRDDIDPVEMTEVIKKLTLHLGADEVGVAPLNPEYVYSNVGRGPEQWGASINNNHKFAVVFTIEMDYEQVETAPQLGITEEAARQYLNAALISTSLAAAIREIGYPARAHISDSNYQIMLPPVAVDAGLGELGRFGYLISKKFGARVRLGGITTDLPLVTDKPIQFGVQKFCEICRKCAVNCPSGAILHDTRKTVRGVNKWPLNVEKCLIYWRLIGTDCGLCMKVCPFSHPPTLLHNLVRTGIKNSAIARHISVYGDDLFYGKKLKGLSKERV